MKYLEATADFVGGTIAWISSTIEAYPNLFRFVFAIVALAALGFLAWTAFRIVRWVAVSIYRTVQSIRWTFRRWGHRMEKTRIFRSLKGKFMAKWQIGELGSRIDDAIFAMEMEGRMSDQQGKRLRSAIGRAIGDHQLIPRRFNKMYLRHYFLGSKDKSGKSYSPVYQKLSGPKKENFKAAGGLPEVPKVETNVSSEFLERQRAKKAAA